MTRIHRDCQSAKERAKRHSATHRDPLRTEGHANRRYDPLRVVVKKELLAVDLISRGRATTEKLRKTVEGVAYGVHDGYSFPSVRGKVPYPHFLAFAILEAVRRGASLRGSRGDPAEVVRRLSGETPYEGQPFMLFSDALSLFFVVAAERHLFSVNRAEGKRVFREAIKLHEAQGAILLTSVDGGGSVDSTCPTCEERVLIHVHPAWFADLVRRIVDIRLLDPAEQVKLGEAMERSVPFDSLQTLSKQHSRFFQAGEVSRDYIKFLWSARDMELGPASPDPRAPRLQMPEETIDLMVGSLLDVRFMFRVRDKDGGVVPDRYMVASCLPDHVDHAVDPGKLLGLKVGGAIFSTRLKLVGAQSLPPGLIPRLIAWCGQGDARIKACWKRGVCFAYNRKHLVLVYECRYAGKCSVIECHAMGIAHDEGAAGTLSDLVEELRRLVLDEKYGFPGVGLFENGEIEEHFATSDKDLTALLSRLEDGLQDHMDVKFEELVRKSDNIAGKWAFNCVESHFLAHVPVYLRRRSPSGVMEKAARRLSFSGLGSPSSPLL